MVLYSLAPALGLLQKGLLAPGVRMLIWRASVRRHRSIEHAIWALRSITPKRARSDGLSPGQRASHQGIAPRVEFRVGGQTGRGAPAQTFEDQTSQARNSSRLELCSLPVWNRERVRTLLGGACRSWVFLADVRSCPGVTQTSRLRWWEYWLWSPMMSQQDVQGNPGEEDGSEPCPVWHCPPNLLRGSRFFGYSKSRSRPDEEDRYSQRYPSRPPPQDRRALKPRPLGSGRSGESFGPLPDGHGSLRAG
jgi:hypothetical protein